MKCYNHPDAGAKFKCVSCGLLVCNNCVKSFHAGGFFTYFCPGCNSQCEELEGVAEEPPAKTQTSENKEPAAPVKQEQAKKEESKKVDDSFLNKTLKESPAISKETKIPPPAQRVEIETAKPIPELEDISKDSDILDLEETSLQKGQPTTSIMAAYTGPFINPEIYFQDVIETFQKNSGFKIKFIFVALMLLCLDIALRLKNFPLPFAVAASFIESLIFTVIISFSCVVLKKTERAISFTIYSFGLISFIQVFHSLSLYSIPSEIIALCVVALLALIKFWIFSFALVKYYFFSVTNSILILLTAQITTSLAVLYLSKFF